MLAHLPQAVLWFGANGRLIFCNDQAVQLHGFDKADLKAIQSIEGYALVLARKGELGHGNLRELTNQHVMRIQHELRETQSGVHVLQVQNRYLRARYAKLPEGGFVISHIDVTRQIRAEKELERTLHLLEQANHLLEEKVEERTRELKALQGSLLKAERDAAMSELIAKLSHELRNPLNALNTSLFVIRSKVGDDDRLTKAFDRSQRTIQRCTHILDDLYDFAMTRELKLQPLNIARWVDSNCAQLRLPDDISFKWQNNLPEMNVEVDRKSAEKAMFKLLRNAIQALKDEDAAKGSKQLKLNCYQQDDKLIFEVSDNGPGMTADIRDKALEPLFSTKGFGVGLGLPIAQQVFERHGGGLEIDSQAGKGTTIKAWFPARAAHRAAA